MELVVHLNSRKFINDFIEIGIKNFIVGKRKFMLTKIVIDSIITL